MPSASVGTVEPPGSPAAEPAPEPAPEAAAEPAAGSAAEPAAGSRETASSSAATNRPAVSRAEPSLVARARGGDPEAFGQLYDRYVDLVYRYVYYRVGAVALAEDLTSETFLRALRRLPTFTWQGKDFGAWLVTIARNLITDHYKSGRYRLEVSTANMLDADRAEQAGPEPAVLGSITAATLLDAVRKLGPEQQECVALRFLHGLSIAETALAMRRSEGAIKALQYRAVRTLARLLPADIR